MKNYYSYSTITLAEDSSGVTDTIKKQNAR